MEAFPINDSAWYNAPQIHLEFRQGIFLKLLWIVIMISIGSWAFPAQRDGNILLQDDFRTRINRWSLTRTAKLTVDYSDGQLQMKIISPGNRIWSIPDTASQMSRYHLRVNVGILESSEDSAVGVIFNYQNDENFYLFEIEKQGNYDVQIIEDGEMHTLIEGSIEAARDYLFDMEVVDGEFTFSINDTELPVFEDDTFTKGVFGLFSRAGHGAIHAAFDDLLVVDIQQ